MGSKLTDRQLEILRAVPTSGKSINTTRLANSIGEYPHWIRSPLKALERKGLILCEEQGSTGQPSWWVITPAGRAALTGSDARTLQDEEEK